MRQRTKNAKGVQIGKFFGKMDKNTKRCAGLRLKWAKRGSPIGHQGNIQGFAYKCGAKEAVSCTLFDVFVQVEL